MLEQVPESRGKLKHGAAEQVNYTSEERVEPWAYKDQAVGLAGNLRYRVERVSPFLRGMLIQSGWYRGSVFRP